MNTPSGRDLRDTTSTPPLDDLDAEDTDSNDGGEYCICRGPDDHRMMVYCEGGCDEWFHCACIGMDVGDARKLLDSFVCDNCKTDEKFTRWRRICRNVFISGCRNPCRPNGDRPSKYCSEECKYAWGFWTKNHRFRAEDIPSLGGRLNVYEVEQILTQCQKKYNLELLGRKPRLMGTGGEGAGPSK